MCFVLLFLFVCNVYSATPSQTCARDLEAQSEKELVKMMSARRFPIGDAYCYPYIREESLGLPLITEVAQIRDGYAQCASYEGNGFNVAYAFSAEAHSQISFIACDGTPFSTPGYSYIFGGTFTEHEETTNAIII